MNTPSNRSSNGLSPLAVVGLALLATPRVVLHDLHLVSEGSLVNLALVVVPLAVWIAVVLRARVANPFLTLVVVGLCYGALLAAIHQLLWTSAFAGVELQLGGNLADLDPAAQTALLRGFAAISSLFTGTIVGAICGLVAWAVQRLLDRRSSIPVSPSR